MPYLHLKLKIFEAWVVRVMERAIVLGKCDRSVFRQKEKAYAQFIRFSKGNEQRGLACRRVAPSSPPHTYIIAFLCLKSAVSNRKQDQHKHYYLSILLRALSYSYIFVLTTSFSLCASTLTFLPVFLSPRRCLSCL